MLFLNNVFQCYFVSLYSVDQTPKSTNANLYLRLLAEFMMDESTSAILNKITLTVVKILWKNGKHTKRILDRNIYHTYIHLEFLMEAYWSMTRTLIFGSTEGLACCPFRPFRSTSRILCQP